jgi:Fe-S cluster assembly protein SufD
MTTLDRILEDYQRVASPPREPAAQQLRLLGLPGSTDEHWQYANLRALNRVTNFIAALPDGDLHQAALPPPLAGFRRQVFVNGHPHTPPDAEPGHLDTGAEPARDADLRFGLLAAIFGGAPTTLTLHGTHSIELIYFCTGATGSVYPRLNLRLADNAHVTLIERQLGATASDALLCTDLRMQLAPQAELTHYRLHECGAGTQLLDNLSATLAAGSVYRSHHIAAGATNTRSSNTVDLTGSGASFCWNGLATVQDGESYDSLVRITHQASATRSEHRLRGIATGHAHISSNADVRVRASAAGARVSQSLRGLIDGAGASINLQPRLTIDTDDIQASHGATTGQLDENLLFYLLSRGIDRETARTLLKWAFLGDVLATIELPAVRRDAERLAAGRLADVLGMGITT